MTVQKNLQNYLDKNTKKTDNKNEIPKAQINTPPIAKQTFQFLIITCRPNPERVPNPIPKSLKIENPILEKEENNSND